MATAFPHFMRAQYERHYADSSLPEQFHDGPVFLLGGFGTADVFPSLYKVDVQKNSCRLYYGAGTCGATWEGQSDAVERMRRGFDSEIRCKVDAIHRGAMRLYSAQVNEAIAEALAAYTTQVGDAADGLQIRLPDLPAIAMPWGGEDLPIQYATLSLQDAVELAAFLVNVQSARAKFGSGIATVGGRTHIGVVTRRSFKMLDEPQPRHTNTGFTS